MTEQNLTANSCATTKKSCKVKNFFTKEAKEGQRVPNWKFFALIVVVLFVAWLI